jgi:photosystem II stability/assembly factor-like uncharacterized protein
MNLRIVLASLSFTLMLGLGYVMLRQVQPARYHKAFEDPTELDKLYKLREQMMLADPATGEIPANLRSREMAFYHANLEQRATRSVDEWISTGPWNVGGRTRALAIDRTNENIFIAAGVSGGIYRTTDAGKSWTLVSDTVSHQGIISLCQDGRVGFENIWYAVGGEASGNSASGGGAYYLGDGAFKSTDSGKSWQPIASTAGGNPASFSTEFQVCWRVVSSPRVDTPVVFLAAYGLIFRSLDGGVTFTPSLATTSNQSYYTDVVVASDGTAYATLSSDGAKRGFYRSTNNGATWSDITPVNLISKYDRTVMGINPNNENEVYFFSLLVDSTNNVGAKTGNFNDNPEWISLLKYTYINGDGTGAGGQWQDKSQALPTSHNTTTGKFDRLNVQGGYDMYVKVQPVTGAVFIAGTNVYRSSNAFNDASTTIQIGGYAPATAMPNFGIYPNHHPDCHDLLFFKSDYKKVLCASDGGVHLSLDANAANVAWISCNNGYLTTQPYTVTLDPTRYSSWMLSGFQDNGNYVNTNFRNPQQRWTMPFNGDGAYNYIAPNKDFFLMSTQEGKLGIFKLDENGKRIKRRRIDPEGPTSDDYVFINPFAVDLDNDNILYVPAGKYLYRHSNVRSIEINDVWEKLGTGWFRLPDSITTAVTASGFKAQITSIAVSRNNANIVYIGTNNRDVFRIDNANTNTPLMTKLTKPPLPSAGNNASAYVSSICIDDKDANKVIVVYSNYGLTSMFYSEDAGTTWKICAGNLEKNTNPSGVAPSIRCVDMFTMPDGSKRYFAATSVGLYTTQVLKPGNVLSKDSTVWVQEATGSIGTTVCNYVTHRNSDYTVAVSTHGKGTFIREYRVPGIDTATTMQMAIYPNPTSSFTNIKLDKWGSSTATIIMYTTDGKVVRRAEYTNLNGERDFITVNTDLLARGNYIIELTDGVQKRICKKIVLLP